MIHLRPYQSTVVADLRQAFLSSRSILLVSPTGSGKTVIFSYLASSVLAKGKLVYILVHREELVEQVSNTLKAFDVPHGFIAAGRPHTPFPVMVCSVFTLANRINSYRKPDLIIIDEAHHACSGSTWGRVLGAWHDSYRLGVTATPIRLDGRDLTGHFERMVQGPTVAELIANGDLCRYKMYTPPVALGKLRMRMGDYVKSDMAAAIDKPQITGNAVEHYTKLAAGKRALVFCVSLEHAAHVQAEFADAGYRSARIDGAMDRLTRRNVVSEFSAGGIQVMTSCDLVSEGFDLPAIEVAILLRPTASLGLYLQQVGRALRTHTGKSHALILDHAGNAGQHGLPDDEREWSLGDEDSKTRKKKPVTSLRTCGKCFAAAKPGTMVCAECGWQWPIEARKVEQSAGELAEITEDVERQRRIEARRQVGQSKTLEALVALEKQRGYRPGWASHVFNARRRA